VIYAIYAVCDLESWMVEAWVQARGGQAARARASVTHRRARLVPAMTPSRRPRPGATLPPARTPAEAAERFRAAGYRVRRPGKRKRAIVVQLPSLLPFLFAEHGPQTAAEE
jgi:hypothetical protein